MKSLTLALIFSVNFATAIPAGPLSISPEAKALIVDFETGGQSYYIRHASRPEWPGGASGVTIGIGYDVGYNTASQIRGDWSVLPAGQLNALVSCAGMKGATARPRAAALRWFSVPWGTAEAVFVQSTMPRFGRMTAAAFPGITGTHPHVQGAMLSIVFNRGASMSGNSRIEMRRLRGHIARDDIRPCPAEIRAMKRLWASKGLDGLLRRREAEARLIEKAEMAKAES